MPADPATGRPVTAVLFDMDGTLSDTERFWHDAEAAIVSRYGRRLSERDEALLTGASMAAAEAYLPEQCGVDLSPERIGQLVTDHVVARMRDGFDWSAGAPELLAEVNARGLRTALVTTSPRTVADAVIDRLPAGSFDAIVTEDDVERTKPHPEPYTMAARLLDVTAAECLAIEDSANGARSAISAGCAVAVVGTAPMSLPDGVVRVPSLQGVTFEGLLQRLGQPVR